MHKRKQEVKCPACDGTGSAILQTFNQSRKGFKLESSTCLRCNGAKWLTLLI